MAEKRQNFMVGAAILTASTLIVKILGLLFSVPLANFISQAGMSYFYTAYDIFAIFLMLSTAGLPIAVSRMVGTAYSQGRQKEADRVFSVAFWLFFGLGLMGCLIMFFFSAPIARIMGNPGAAHAIMALAPTLFFISIMSALRGYFQGRGNMVPTALSQTVEAVTKVIIGVGLAAYIITKYESDAWAAVGAIIGVSVSAALGTIYLAGYKLRQSRRDKAERQRADAQLTRAQRAHKRAEERALSASRKEMLIALIKFAVPITLGSCFLSLLDNVDAAILMHRLQTAAGLSLPQAEDLRGVLGHARKFFDLPGAFVIPISTSLLPALSGAVASGDVKNSQRILSMSIRVTLLIAVPATFGMCLFAGPICDLLLFNVPATAAATAPLLAMLSVAIAFNSTLYTTNAILQAFGHPVIPVRNMAIGGIVKIILSYLLIGIPQINAMGSCISTVVSYLLIMILNFIAVKNATPGIGEAAGAPVPIVISAAVMGAASFGVYQLLKLGMSGRLAVLPAILLAVLVYAVCAVKLRAVTYNLVLMLPKGELIARVLRLKEA